tara:strand:- start:857 stop:1867 length:1011 start_codon:yes stop_codon:yes gene_type:complete
MLPAILGYAASAIAPSIGMNAILASALGSGIGSLIQGGTTEDALEAAALGGIGAGIGGQLGKADPKVLATPYAGGTQTLPPAMTMQGGTTGVNAAQNLTSGMTSPSLMNPNFDLANFSGMGPIGAGIGASFALPPAPKKEEDDFVAPRGMPISSMVNKRPSSYRPGFSGEFDYGFQRNFQEGGLVNMGGSEEAMGQMNDKELINSAVEAIKGTGEGSELILGQFLARFGEEALRDLVEKVQSGQFDDNTGDAEGMVEGAGDGMDDMIPASMTDADQDVLLSDGEFVVPADVVSGLGNGSSDAGADKLEDMMGRVRELRTGGKTQPPDIPDEMMLPA